MIYKILFLLTKKLVSANLIYIMYKDQGGIYYEAA